MASYNIMLCIVLWRWWTSSMTCTQRLTQS